MDRALFTAMSGAKNNMLAQSNHANNLANANTQGFRADFTQARSMAVYYGEGHPSRVFSLTENPGTDFRPGPIDYTGRELDIAMNGEGFFAISAPDGTEAYSRDGALSIDINGILRNSSGHPVLGDGGFIAIPPAEKIEIASDGTISAVLLGQGVDQPVQIDRIKMVSIDHQELEKFEDGLVRLREGGLDGATRDADVNLRLQSGYIEASNVNPVEEFTDLLSLARQYEVQVKMMKTVKENSEASARLLQSS
ncbi:flagellar basal body rod protein FlgF [uncultured Pseudoteredinibacter sp.]|uniref:flagellar basal body rod protein FlgF n=1 Tax=uncultured Pseudoteredinibacter sp. TaxID=1641701 RepID=UPI00263493E3|nr:flagellar basal body rod protein FlgF [uncultured Pseudoteredinibacter sp.]